MPQTPTYNLRYPALSDQPNGPVQLGNLAGDTETALTTVNAVAVSAAAAAATVVGGNRYVTGTTLATTSSGTEILTATGTGSFPVVNGQAYEVEWGFAHQLSIGTDVFTVRIRDTNVSGAIQFEDNIENEAINRPLFKTFKFILKPTSTTSRTFVGTMARLSGTGGLDSKPDASGKSYFKVTRLGPTTLIPDV